MKIILLLLLGLTFVAFVIGKIYDWRLKMQLKKGKIKAIPEPVLVDDNACCGKHDTCEKQRVLRAFAQNEIIYYEDEELDRFKNKSSDAYTIDEEEEFREVLVTLQKDEIKGWLTSLQLREIAIPDGLKDEISLVLA